ncbi:glycerophosphodiester phosphodiesterase [Paenibacillus macerans]|uniref:Glycerophosphoryl diester phosphodiesterase n=1 Tax=Paenibacillus macerans TaxID=44252 RepID=A0A090Y6A4_PAEMA|nr:glycerophosphodiester phosphodiesterase family protein [Paenibacillus macerans]KFM94283.1 glycerophosphoryl diester phosphodiesterase [Paenibacillus macerans]MCY7561827.1 glycerophosphodiester phosphodiesterase [Paenibacillus macerans]MEC0149710.1 glycerophosphodiester phosphodiesterase family protein [Paenibacillus macerans]UMV48447.1 glycerophosphodiester phosphodiesterase [Paenibacillus macerans]SUD25566.1 glycerophosphoryl diester phosphodiesterase [Paenibacillus macerans]
MIGRLESADSPLMVAGHRGYKSAYPENTLLAFRKALDLGVDMLEFDLRLSKDGVLMVIHDATLDRTTNGTGPVGGHTLEELKKLDAGGWFGREFTGLQIPTLEELIALLASYPDVLLNVEIKPAEDAKQAADQAVALLERAGFLARCLFTCFDAAVLAHIHDTYGLKTQGFPAELMSGFVPGEAGTYSKMWALGLEMKLLTPERVREFHGLGLLVWSYCPDETEQVQYSVECGVTGMTCNNPLPALHFRRGMAARLPGDAK